MNFIFHRHWFRLAKRGAWIVALALAVDVSLRAQERPTDYQVKAAFLFHFGQFVEWPEKGRADTNHSFVIGVFGNEDPFHGDLKHIVADAKIAGHPIEIRHVKALPDLRSCQVVFIPASEKAQEHDLLDAMHDQPVLTVSDADDFYDSGGMIQFVLENNQVHFKINNAAAHAAGLKISSKLLILAEPKK